MNRYLLKLSLASIVYLAFSVPTFAQPDNDTAHWLDRDVTLLINIDDVPTTYEKIKSLELVSNPRFIRAISMLSDERFPVVEKENFEQIVDRLYELESLVRRIKQISFAIHDIDEKVFHWSLFVRAEAEVLDLIQDGIGGIDGQLTQSDPPNEIDGSNSEPNDPETTPENADLGDVRWGEFQRTDQWLILSNHSSFLEALPDRVDNEKFRSLGKSRKYRAIIKRESPLNDRDGLITVYGNPARMRFLVPHATRNEWDLDEIDELPACGLNFVITDSDHADQTQPIVLADAVVKFTKPTVGQAKFLEHYRAIEIPPMAVEPIELLAFARDEKAVAEESIRLYDQTHGPNAADVVWRTYFIKLGIDYLTDAVPRRNAFFEMRFVDKDHTFDRPGLISLERLNDKQAALRYAEKVVGYANRPQQQRKLGIHEDGPNIWWTMPRQQFIENSGRRGFDRKRHSRIDFYNGWHDAYVLTDQWWVQGDMPAVKDQVELLTTGDGEDHAQPIKDLVQDLTRRLGADDPPIMLKYYTKDAWQENLNNVEQHYANANSTPFRFKIVQVNGNGIQLVREPDSGESSKPLQGTFKIELAPENKNSDKGKQGSKNIQLSNLQSLQLMMPMRLAKRNEDGHRIPLKKRDDLETAICVMILKSVSESFPRQLFLYTRNDHHIRIMMGVYPTAVREKND